MDTKLSVIMISWVSQFRSTEEKLKSNHAEIKKRNFNKPLRMTTEDEENFKKADKCHICYKKYVSKDIRAGNHCHLAGKYRGATHQDCNINHFRSKAEDIKVPIIFHNLRGYDSHFIAQ